MDGKIHAGSVLHCRLRFGAGGSAYLYISFCKWAPGNERNRIWEIFKRDTMETEKQYLRYPANDRRKSVCDRRSDYFWGADRYPDIRIHGTLLSEADLSSTEDGNRTSGRYSFRSIWIFWIGRPGAVDKEHCQIPAACRHYQTIRKW